MQFLLARSRIFSTMADSSLPARRVQKESDLLINSLGRTSEAGREKGQKRRVKIKKGRDPGYYACPQVIFLFNVPKLSWSKLEKVGCTAAKTLCAIPFAFIYKDSHSARGWSLKKRVIETTEGSKKRSGAGIRKIEKKGKEAESQS